MDCLNTLAQRYAVGGVVDGPEGYYDRNGNRFDNAADRDWANLTSAYAAADQSGGFAQLAYMPSVGLAQSGGGAPASLSPAYSQITPEQFGQLSQVTKLMNAQSPTKFDPDLTDASLRSKLMDIGPQAYEMFYGRQATPAPGAYNAAQYSHGKGSPMMQSFLRDRGLTPEQEARWRQYLGAGALTPEMQRANTSQVDGMRGVSGVSTL